MPSALDKQLPIPLYYQLKSLLLEEIQSGRWKPDDQIPTETDLAQSYSISKMTVRQALRELADLGYVRREQGRGTFVARAPLEQGPRELTSFSQQMRRYGMNSGSRVLESGVIPADPTIAGHLRVAEGSEIFLLTRLRLADGEPMGIQTAYIPLALAPGMPQESMDNASLYELLQLRYNLQPSHARETHWAILVEAGNAELLGVPAGSPALAAERITFLQTGKPLEFVTSIMRGDRYRAVLDLVREPAAGLR